MAKITYLTHDGQRHVVDVSSGQSVMEGAVQNGIPGIDADCTGNCACGTCHVHVDRAWLTRVGAAGPGEAAMIDMSANKREESRLSCQIKVIDALDGLIVTTPRTQRE